MNDVDRLKEKYKEECTKALLISSCKQCPEGKYGCGDCKSIEAIDEAAALGTANSLRVSEDEIKKNTFICKKCDGQGGQIRRLCRECSGTGIIIDTKAILAKFGEPLRKIDGDTEIMAQKWLLDNECGDIILNKYGQPKALNERMYASDAMYQFLDTFGTEPKKGGG